MNAKLDIGRGQPTGRLGSRFFLMCSRFGRVGSDRLCQSGRAAAGYANKIWVYWVSVGSFQSDWGVIFSHFCCGLNLHKDLTLDGSRHFPWVLSPFWTSSIRWVGSGRNFILFCELAQVGSMSWRVVLGRVRYKWTKANSDDTIRKCFTCAQEMSL